MIIRRTTRAFFSLWTVEKLRGNDLPLKILGSSSVFRVSSILDKEDWDAEECCADTRGVHSRSATSFVIAVASVGLAVALKSFSVAREKNRPHCRFSCRVNN